MEFMSDMDLTLPETGQTTDLGPGAKLLCIDDANLRRRYVPGPPVKGRIYCAREFYLDHGVQGVLLVGIRGPLDANGLECGFLLTRFRWVHE